MELTKEEKDLIVQLLNSGTYPLEIARKVLVVIDKLSKVEK